VYLLIKDGNIERIFFYNRSLKLNMKPFDATSVIEWTEGTVARTIPTLVQRDLDDGS